MPLVDCHNNGGPSARVEATWESSRIDGDGRVAHQETGFQGTSGRPGAR